MVDVATVRRLGRTLVSCQLIFFATFNAVRGASACNPAKTSPVEPARDSQRGGGVHGDVVHTHAITTYDLAFPGGTDDTGSDLGKTGHDGVRLHGEGGERIFRRPRSLDNFRAYLRQDFSFRSG